LTIETHVAGDLRRRERIAADGAEDLPARAGELEVFDQPIAGGDEFAVQPEDREDQLRVGFGRPGVRRNGWLSPCVILRRRRQIDKTLSLWHDL
jgi:hypothetical protein